MGFSFGEPIAPLTPPLSPELSRRAPVGPKLQGRSAQAIREVDSDEYEEDEEDIAMREYYGRKAPQPKESLLDLLNSAPPGWREEDEAPPSPSMSMAPSVKSSKSARFLPTSLRGLKSRGSSRNQPVGEPLRGSKSSHDLRHGKSKSSSAPIADFSHDLPPLPAAPMPKLATKDAVRARGSSTADLANFLRSSGPPQLAMAPVSEFGGLPTASANPRRRSQTLSGLGIHERSQSSSTYGTTLDNYYSTVTHEAPVNHHGSGASSDEFEEMAAPARAPSRQSNGPAALQRGNSTGGDSWHTTHSSMTERRANAAQSHSPVASPRYTRGHGSVPVLVRQGSVASVSSHLTLNGGGLSPTSSRRLSRKPPPSPTELELSASQSSSTGSVSDRQVISASTMAALQQLQQSSPHPKSPTPVIAEEPSLDNPVAIPRPPRGGSTNITTTPVPASAPAPAPSPAFVPVHKAAQSSVDLAATNLAAQFTRPTSIHLNNLPLTAEPSRLSAQLDEAERALLRSRPSSPPPDEPLPAPPSGPSPLAKSSRPPRESSLPRHASLSVESARLLAANGPTSKADKRKSTMRLSSYGSAELAFSSPAPSMDSFQSSVVDPPLAGAVNVTPTQRPTALVSALGALQAAMRETASVGLGEEADSVRAMVPILRGLQSQFTLAANLVAELIAVAEPHPATAESSVVQEAKVPAADAGEAAVVAALLGGHSPTLAYAGVSELSDHDSSDGEDEDDPETDASIERAEVVVRTPTTPNMFRNDSLP